jgi:hypothetical protein
MGMSLTRAGRSLATASVVAALVGSGCAEQETGATVKGKVTYQGAPVARGTISFIQLSGLSASSKLHPDGSYSLVNQRGTEFLPVGDYDVVIMAGEELIDMSRGNELLGTMKIPVPASVLRLATTPLHYTLVEGPNTIDINLDKLPKKK